MSDHVTCLLRTIVFSLHLEYPKSLPWSVDHCIIWPLPRFLNTSLLLSFSLTLLQSHWPFCSSWNMPSTFLLWGLYTSSFWSFYDHSLTSFRSLIRPHQGDPSLTILCKTVLPLPPLQNPYHYLIYYLFSSLNVSFMKQECCVV